MEPHTDLDSYYKEKVDELLAKERRQTWWLALKCVVVLAVLLALVLLVTAGCVTTTMPDGTTVREWDTGTIWEMARVAQEIAVLRAELRAEEHQMDTTERRLREQHIENLLERLTELRGDHGQD